MTQSKTAAIAALTGALAAAAPAAKASTFATLYSFTNQADGLSPVGPLLSYHGAFYGVTLSGGIKKKGTAGGGTVFKFDPVSNTLTTLHTFSDKPDGDAPNAPLIVVGDTLFGTTQLGGVTNSGTVYSVSLKTGKETVLYSFAGGADGINPTSALTYVNHLLFGVTHRGGSCATCGVVYAVDPASGVKTTVHSFAGDDAPFSNLVLLRGILYGATGYTLFSLKPDGTGFTTLYSFSDPGSVPGIRGLSGRGNSLYGIFPYTSPGYGFVFSFDIAAGLEKQLYAFQGHADGAAPAGDPLIVKGLLYGTTMGAQDDTKKQPFLPGSIWSINPKTGHESTLYTFPAVGYFAGDGLAILNGTYYGVTIGQGDDHSGSIFSFTP